MTIESLNAYFFGPLGKEYCDLFWAFSVVAFLSILIIVISVVSTAAMSKSKFDAKPFIFAIPFVISYTIVYFQNRILNSMCLKTMK